jgi:hypothetical protein
MKKNAVNDNVIKGKNGVKIVKDDRLAYYRDLQITLASPIFPSATNIPSGMSGRCMNLFARFPQKRSKGRVEPSSLT